MNNVCARTEQHPNRRRLSKLFEVYQPKVVKKNTIVTGQKNLDGSSKAAPKSVKLVEMSGERARDSFALYATIVDAMAPHERRFKRIQDAVSKYAKYYRLITVKARTQPPTTTIVRSLLAFERAFADLVGDEEVRHRPSLTRDFDFGAYERDLTNRVNLYNQQRKRQRTDRRTWSIANNDEALEVVSIFLITSSLF